MTLVEVVVAMLLVTMFATTAFTFMNFVTKWSVRNAYRGEATRLAQDKAEELMAGSFDSLAASGDETIVSSVDTQFRPSTLARNAYPPARTASRLTLIRNVTLIASTTTTKQVQVNVRWTLQAKTYAVSLPLFRADSL